MSSREDNGAEGPKRKRGDSGGEHDRIIKEADVIRKQQDHSDDIKRLATELFERAHLEDSDISLLKLSLDAIKFAVKTEQEVEVLRAESRRNKFLFEAGDWFAGVINGLRKFKGLVRPEAQKDLRADLKALGKSANDADALVQKSANWEACRGRRVVDMTAVLKREMAEVRDFRKSGNPAGLAPETPFLDRFEKLCDRAKIGFDNLCKYAELYNERNDVAHSGLPHYSKYQVETSDKDGNRETGTNWSEILTDVEKKIDEFEQMWKTGQIDEEQFHIAEHSVRDWFKMRVKPLPKLGEHTVWQQTLCAEKELKELEDQAKNKNRGGQKGYSPPASPYKQGKWDDILPA